MKAQSMSMNTIVIAILALIVLITITLIYTGKLTFFSKNTSSCEARGGTCLEAGKDSCPEQTLYTGDCGKKVDKPLAACCVSLI